MRTLELDLDVYQGPFDLLLSLVLKEEIDLLEVPLFPVILAYLEEMDRAGATADWDERTEFLLLMSLLVEVKSRLLLPGTYPDLEAELTPEQARDQLLARLFEYSKFKTAAARLQELAAVAAAAPLRAPAAEPKRLLAPLEEVAGTGDVIRLRDHLLRLVESRGEPDTSHIVQIKVELRRQIRAIRSLLAGKGHFSFNTAFGNEEPLVQALSLFALLDLLARGDIRVSQAKIFGDIYVKANKAADRRAEAS